MKKNLFLLFCSLLFIVLLCGFCFLLLPNAANRYLLPQIANKLPFADAQISITTITPWQIQGALRLQDGADSGIEVPRFIAYFTPGKLLKGIISLVVIDGITVYVDKTDGDFRISGMQQHDSKRNHSQDIELPIMPVTVEEVRVKKCTIAIAETSKPLRILEVGATLRPSYEKTADSRRKFAAIEGEIKSKGAVVLQGSFTTNPVQSGHRLSFSLEVDEIGNAASFISGAGDLGLKGSLHVTGSLQTLGLTGIDEYSAVAQLHTFALVQNSISLHNNDDGRPVLLELQGTSKRLQFQVAELQVDTPQKCAVAGTGEYLFDDGGIDASFTLFPQLLDVPVEFAVQGKVGKETSLNYQLASGAFALPQNIEVDGFNAEGMVEIGPETKAVTLRGTVPGIKDSKSTVALRGITVDVSYNDPEPAPGVVIPGNLFIDEIRYKGVNSGKLDGALSITGDRLIVNSQLTSPLVADLNLKCSTEADSKGDIQATCYMPKVNIDSASVNNVIALPEKLTFDVAVGVESRFQIKNGIPSGTAHIDYSEGRVTFDKYILSNIYGKLELPSLPELRSSPSQLLSIGSIELGRITMSDAGITLRIDSPQTIFIERAKLGWCGGRVETGGLEIQKDMDHLETTLYCDRVGYTELLNQLGIGKAQGEGSLNGRLPIKISKDGLEFDDGFLFSTPGNSGIVRFTNTEQFRQGIGTAERSVYLDYSMDALQNFSYNWTKLTFTTEEDELLLTLQLDGKPAEPLPYGYKAGQIVKKSEGDGIQHPIRLDVNFRLPLRELFRYGKNIQSIMENL